MLPRKLRLVGKKAAERVYRKGSKMSGHYFTIRMIPNWSGRPRVAVVVSTAVSKKATERNRAKRIVRALLSGLKLPAHDLVVSVRRLPNENWYQTYKKELTQWLPEK